MSAAVFRKTRFLAPLMLLAYANCGEGSTEPAVATTVEAGSLTALSAVAGSPVSPAPSVIVRDQNGDPFAGAPVTFEILSGGGTITGSTALTDAAGVARVGEWMVGKIAGPNELSANSASLSVRFTATGIPGPAASMTIAAGDHQIAVTGSVVPIPPAVLVRDVNGNPITGFTVTFAIGAGGGAVTGANAISNAAGVATVGSWKLGDAPATNTLVATAAGVLPLTFSAIGGSAKCSAQTPNPLGATTAGTLDANDCAFPDGRFVDFFSTVLTSANAYLFRQSGNFDTYLDLSLADGTVVAENDDESQTNTNSAIKALLPAGTYVLGASSFNPAVTGSYTVSSQVTSTDNANCELMFVVKDVSTSQRIATTDCLWTQPPAAAVYADAYYILLRAGQSISINMTSTDVDSYLELVRVSGMSVAQNDNRVGTTKDAQITFTATVTDYYAVVARTAIAAQTGAYTLSIQ
ncbi:MAG: Ig-like domain-containing protein [Gemmatimonadaceae bacterium]